MDGELSSWLRLLAHSQPFLLVYFRVLGLFIAAPLVSSVLVPQRYKALLALMLFCEARRDAERAAAGE